jgi:hypothetical protein
MNVNIGQLRTLIIGVPAAQLVTIQAGTLLSLLNLVKTLQGGADAAITAVASPNRNAAPVDLSAF